MNSISNMGFQSGGKKKRKLNGPSDVSSEPDTSDFEDDGNDLYQQEGGKK